MDATVIGIDVSKDRLDVHVLPSGEAFAVARDGEGLTALVARLSAGPPVGLVGVEATGGFETVVAAALDIEIDEAVRGSPAWRENEELLRGVPGVGPVLSRTLIAEMPELGRLDRRQVAALVSLAPLTRKSRKWRWSAERSIPASLPAGRPPFPRAPPIPVRYQRITSNYRPFRRERMKFSAVDGNLYQLDVIPVRA